MKPEWCPKWAWDEARAKASQNFTVPIGDKLPLVLSIARALLEVEQRGRREGMEEAAKIVDAECDRVLSKQDGKHDEIDRNIRLIALLLPEVAAAIRAKIDEVQN